MSVNKCILVGRLTKDPELKRTPTGMTVTKFSLATNEEWKDKTGQKKERSEFHNIVVWGNQAEACAKYLSKGKQAYVEGKLQTRSWEDQTGNKRYMTEINATTVQFLGGKSDTRQTKQQNILDQDYEIESNAAYTASDIPF